MMNPNDWERYQKKTLEDIITALDKTAQYLEGEMKQEFISQTLLTAENIVMKRPSSDQKMYDDKNREKLSIMLKEQRKKLEDRGCPYNVYKEFLEMEGRLYDTILGYLHEIPHKILFTLVMPISLVGINMILGMFEKHADSFIPENKIVDGSGFNGKNFDTITRMMAPCIVHGIELTEVTKTRPEWLMKSPKENSFQSPLTFAEVAALLLHHGDKFPLNLYVLCAGSITAEGEAILLYRNKNGGVDFEFRNPEQTFKKLIVPHCQGRITHDNAY